MVTLPGCGHRFHTSCALTFTQYDARCPICRAVPQDVIPRSNATTSLSQTLQDIIDERQRSWIRYRTRRRRCLNRNPDILKQYDALAQVRRERGHELDKLEHLFRTKCREVWRGDATILQLRRNDARLRRHELRLERRVHYELDRRIGSEPV